MTATRQNILDKLLKEVNYGAVTNYMNLNKLLKNILFNQSAGYWRISVAVLGVTAHLKQSLQF